MRVGLNLPRACGLHRAATAALILTVHPFDWGLSISLGADSILASILLLIYHLAGGSGVYLMLISGLGLIVGAKCSGSLLFARSFLPSSTTLKTRLGGV